MLVLEWLTQSIRDLQRPVNDVSDFVLKNKDYTRITADFQPKRDQIDLYGQFFAVLQNIGYNKINKKDHDAINDASKESTRLTQLLAEVEQKMEAEMDKHKKDLDRKIP